MKVSKEMMLREIAGEHILIPVGEAAKKFSGLISLNESGRMLWERLQEDCSEEDLVTALLDEYEVDRETAAADVKAFLAKMQEADLLLENI